MSNNNQNVIREGENDTNLQHFTDTDPNRYDPPGFGAEEASIRAPPVRPSTGHRRNSGSTINTQRRSLTTFAEGTEGNPLRGPAAQQQNNLESDAAEMPNVGMAVEQRANPSMAPKRRGKVQIEDSGNNLGSGEPSSDMMSGALSQSQSQSMATFGSLDTGMPLSPSKSLTLEARRKAGEDKKKSHEKKGKNQGEPNMFASMMLGGGFNPNAVSGDFSPMANTNSNGGDAGMMLGGYDDDGARSMARSHRSMARSQRSVTNGVGDVIGALPQDDGPAMLVPATMEAPDQIFMPNMKREPYVPVRLARDKIKQALSEIASHNSKHYSAIDTMEKQYEILKAQMEHQVATYSKKLTFHYNQRVADLNKQLKERLTSGAKGEAFSQLMSDVEKWKSRATDAEQELEIVKKELEQMKQERDEARLMCAALEQQNASVNSGLLPNASTTDDRLAGASTATALGMPTYGVNDDV